MILPVCWFGFLKDIVMTDKKYTMSSTNFTVSGLIFKSLIEFELILLYDIGQWSSFILLHVTIHFPNTIYWEYSFSIVCSLLLCHKLIIYIYLDIYVDFWAHDSFHWSMCPILRQYNAVLIIIDLWYNLKSGSVMPPVLPSLLRIILVIQGGLFGSIRNIRLFVLFLWKISLGFWFVAAVV